MEFSRSQDCLGGSALNVSSLFTPPKFNVNPEKLPSQEERIVFQSQHFSGAQYVKLQGSGVPSQQLTGVMKYDTNPNNAPEVLGKFLQRYSCFLFHPPLIDVIFVIPD